MHADDVGRRIRHTDAILAAGGDAAVVHAAACCRRAGAGDGPSVPGFPGGVLLSTPRHAAAAIGAVCSSSWCRRAAAACSSPSPSRPKRFHRAEPQREKPEMTYVRAPSMESKRSILWSERYAWPASSSAREVVWYYLSLSLQGVGVPLCP
uniref:Uncharacterized protein n=1 Tax=Triticum urartu TaxID=4572 RepID=A0A8R7UDM6_TRIUA